MRASPPNRAWTSTRHWTARDDSGVRGWQNQDPWSPSITVIVWPRRNARCGSLPPAARPPALPSMKCDMKDSMSLIARRDFGALALLFGTQTRRLSAADGMDETLG